MRAWQVRRVTCKISVMALTLTVPQEARPDTRQTSTANPRLTSNLMPGMEQYGRNPLFGRLPVPGLAGFNLETLDLLEADPLLTLELLPLLFPDASLALHNILRLGNPGWTLSCTNTRSGKKDPEALRRCMEIMSKANSGVDTNIPGAMGGPDALINSLFFSTYLKGAACAETVLNETLDDVEDIVYVDPHTILFQERSDKRGRYQVFQLQQGRPHGEKVGVPTLPSHEQGADMIRNRIELNMDLVTYRPVDETLNGRSPVAPALQLLIFWTRYFITLQVFLHNAAFGDKDGEIDTRLLLALLDGNMTDGERALWEKDFWGQLVKVTKIFADDYKSQAKLDPDSALIHSDLLKMSALGTAKSSYPVEEVQKIMKREIFNALKMLPILMGSNEGVTETHATVQMAVFTSGLNYYQGVVKHVIERSLQIGLRAQGYARATQISLDFVQLSFDDRQKLALAIETEINNAITMRDQNFITQDDASIMVTGTKAVGPAPVVPDPNPTPPDPTTPPVAARRSRSRKAETPANQLQMSFAIDLPQGAIAFAQ